MSQRVFVTGVTGYLGSAIAARLVRGGYSVHGLTRNPERATQLAARGIHPVIGTLARPETYLATLKNCDAAVHTAFDPSDVVRQDQMALEAFRDGALDGRLRRLLYTSGLWVHGDTAGQDVDERSPLMPLDLVRWRAAHEEVALDLAEFEMQVVVLRPAIVYGGSGGILGTLFTELHEQHTVHYPGSGTQFWSMIHRDDLAEAYLRALERTRGGERYLLSDGTPYTARQIAEAIALTGGAHATARDAQDVLRQLGLFGRALLASTRVRSDLARFELGWTPRHTSFVEDAWQLSEEWQAARETPVA